MDYGILVSEFELGLSYKVHFQTYTQRGNYEPLSYELNITVAIILLWLPGN